MGLLGLCGGPSCLLQAALPATLWSLHAAPVLRGLPPAAMGQASAKSLSKKLANNKQTGHNTAALNGFLVPL